MSPDRTAITQRDAFWDEIYEMALKDSDIVVVSADMGAPALDRIRKNLAPQFVNAGIAEQNAVLVAAGLALMGKKPLVYAIAPFVTLRCLEQIRVNSAIMKIPLTYVGVGVGFGYADSGPTHHLIEDISIMRSMPEISTYNVTDSVMAKKLARLVDRDGGSVYLRLERPAWPDIHAADDDFSAGITLLRQGSDCLILATGSMVFRAMDIAAILDQDGISCGVADIYRFPVNEELFLRMLTPFPRLVSLEEHFLPGGMGSMLGEILIDHGIGLPLTRIGIPHDKAYCYRYGGREEIRAYYGLDHDSVLQRIRAAVA